MARRVKPNQIAVSPVAKLFSGTADGVSRLVRFLKERDTTRPKLITNARDLMLDANTGMLQRQYRLTTPALSQVCSLLCPGLGQVIYDVSGLHRTKREGKASIHSLKRAIRIYNDMIRFRGSWLERHELILDYGTHTVEGVVGPEYHYYSNFEFWEQVQEFLADNEQEVEFHGAVYRNRRLSIRYRFCKPAFLIDVVGTKKKEPFYGGWHFTNSEIGDCAVHATSLLLRRWSNSVALIPLPGDQHARQKLVHRGNRKRFMAKLNDMFGRLHERTGFAETLKPRVLELRDKSLGLGGSAKSHQRRIKALINKLVKGKLSPRQAKETIRHVLFHGSYRADSVRDAGTGPVSYDELCRSTHMDVFGARTAFDLFNALGVQAREERPERQELAEHLAYKLLVGSFVLE